MSDDQILKARDLLPDKDTDFVAAVRQGIEELDQGQGIAIEEVEQELPSWVLK